MEDELKVVTDSRDVITSLLLEMTYDQLQKNKTLKKSVADHLVVLSDREKKLKSKIKLQSKYGDNSKKIES